MQQLLQLMEYFEVGGGQLKQLLLQLLEYFEVAGSSNRSRGSVEQLEVGLG